MDSAMLGSVAIGSAQLLVRWASRRIEIEHYSPAELLRGRPLMGGNRLRPPKLAVPRRVPHGWPARRRLAVRNHHENAHISKERSTLARIRPAPSAPCVLPPGVVPRQRTGIANRSKIRIPDVPTF
jgi:hypothetical protein